MKLFTKRKVFAFIFIILVITSFMLYKKYHLSSDKAIDYVQDHAKLGWLFFIVFYAATVLIIAIPETPFTIAAGILFPYWIGVTIVMIGSIIGAMTAFLLSKYLFHNYFHRKLAHTKYLKWTKIKDQNKLTKLTLMARITPFFPFNITNYALAMTKIKPNNFFAATLVGILPGIFLLVFVGRKLEEVIPIEWIMVFSVLCIVFSLIYIFKSKILKKD